MKRRIRNVVTAPWFRLAGTYLAIIMLMSIGFSVVFYRTSWNELGRQIPTHADYDHDIGLDFGLATDNAASPTDPSGNVRQFLQTRAQEGRAELLQRLIVLNGLALVLGSALSYYLARRTLRPIEAAMEAQSQFVSDASHELRTPLTALQATNDVALRDPKLTLTKAKSVIQANTEEAVKLQALSNALLNLARQDNSKLALADVSLQAVVSQALTRVVQPAQSKDISIEDRTPDIKLRAEPHALEQILVILLDNAIKYSPAGSTVYLEGRRRGKYGYVSVRDEGAGIRASDLPHIFRRFYRADTSRTDGAAHGYGLGLSIAHKLVERLGGGISVQSEPGKGSTFIVRLPAA
ncbi:MAG TPA: HAMP domain-containing sensor histidine kinase [Candidatus Saccharimonadales bacterium]|nr:HAMP domain-containing sensor histidine kinase [Candidatus Saccharimonadales bacterium]